MTLSDICKASVPGADPGSKAIFIEWMKTFLQTLRRVRKEQRYQWLFFFSEKWTRGDTASKNSSSVLNTLKTNNNNNKKPTMLPSGTRRSPFVLSPTSETAASHAPNPEQWDAFYHIISPVTPHDFWPGPRITSHLAFLPLVFLNANLPAKLGSMIKHSHLPTSLPSLTLAQSSRSQNGMYLPHRAHRKSTGA